MKIQMVDPDDNYVIETIDVESYDLDDESSLEQLKDLLLEIVIEYYSDI